MMLCNALKWIDRSLLRSRVILDCSQPLTASQMARRLGINCDTCTSVFADLRRAGILRCLNESARRSRVHWLTDLGSAPQRRLWKIHGIKPVPHFLPLIDWNTFGWLCFSHRAAVLKAFNGTPMQPSEIKRRARLVDDGLRMNANNVRDVIRLFLAKGLVVPLQSRKHRHVRYV